MARLKILHIGKYYSPFHGGIENFTKDLIESEVYQQNVAPSLLVHHHINRNATAQEKIQNVLVRRVKRWFTLLYSPISPSFIKELNKLIEVDKPDVLHIHMPNLSAFFCLLSRKARQIPWVIHWHSDVLGAVPDWRIRIAYHIYRLFENKLLNKSKAIIATSPNYLLSSNPLRQYQNKTFTVPLGLAALTKPSHHSAAERSKALSLLIIGRLTYYKGHEYILKALASVPNVMLKIIGVGELETKLKKLTQQLGVEERVEFLGSVDSEKLNQNILNCDVLCLPSVERTEAFGLVLLEAARLKKPAMVTSVLGSGMSWVVKDKKTGLVVEPNSVDALIKGIIFANENPQVLSEYGIAARKRFESEFTIEQVAKKTLDVYNYALDNK